MLKLGDKAKDIVSGYSGTVVCIAEWLNGCKRVSLQAKVDKDGKIPDLVAFDIEQLEVITTEGNILDRVRKAITGGDRQDAKQRPDAVR